MGTISREMDMSGVGGEGTINYRGISRKKIMLLINERGGRLDEKEVKAVLRGQWGTMGPKYRTRRDREAPT
jgi:hypothetical protein